MSNEKLAVNRRRPGMQMVPIATQKGEAWSPTILVAPAMWLDPAELTFSLVLVPSSTGPSMSNPILDINGLVWLLLNVITTLGEYATFNSAVNSVDEDICGRII
jgi:hypothetical protein